MRVLICDQESEMLERIAREFEVDVATSKVTCIDLMRANPFDVVVASERLVDGSGLELLSSIATRWPDTLRVLAIEPERRKMLGGKLAPFRLHATIRYPVDEDELERRLQELDRLLGHSEGDYADGDASAPSSHGRVPSPQRPASPATARPSASSAPTRSHNVSAAGRAPGAGSSLARQAPATAPPKSGKDAIHQQVRGKSYYSAATRAAAELAPPLVRPKPGSYTPLGAPEEKDVRIVAREFDESFTPLAARAKRAHEEANRGRTPVDKAGDKPRSVADHVSRTLKRLLKR